MAAQRPNVIVFQEFDALTVAPDIPDLHVIIVGPCNQILYYKDDKASCNAGEYGTLNSNSPLVSPDAVVLSAPPNLTPGGIVDADSVNVYFDASRVVLVESTTGAGTPDKGVYTSGDNLFVAHDTTGGKHFGTEEVAPGDILITNSPGVDDYIKTVKDVLYTLHDFATTLDFITAGVQAGDTVILSSDSPPGGPSRDGTYTIVRVRDANTLEFTGLNWVGNAESTFSGTDTTSITVTDPNGAIKLGPTTLELADYSELRTTSDFAANNPVDADWRVERTASDILLDASDFSVSGNQITINAAITVDLSATLTGKKVSFATIYTEYIALRTNLQTPLTLSNFAEMETNLGKYDAKNPLFVGAVVAKANTTTSIKVYGLASDDLPGYLDFIDRISSERDIYAIVPLTYSTSILAALNSMCINLADPNYALDNGIRQKFRVTLGAVDLQTTKEIVTASSGGTTSQELNTAPSVASTGTFAQTGGTNPDFSTAGVIPGDIVRITDTSGPTVTTYTVAHLNGALVVETDEVITTVSLTTGGDTFEILDSTLTTTKVTLEVGVGGVTQLDFTATNLDNLYLILQAPGATFITSGCIPGDLLQMPEDPTTSSFTTYNSWVIDDVISETRVRIVNSGTNSSTVANELPHLFKRTDGSAIVGGTIYFRVLRNLDKTQQINEMVAVANSFSSKRLILAYPNLVDVTSLVDGSITPRASEDTPEPATSQPGYYLACAIGGQTAGNPSQQGFTNFGIAGIDRIYNSSEYFTEEQLTDLSNGGVYTFVQDNPEALPYSIHALTTDVTALEFSEYMIVKNFDFVAWTYLDTLVPFIGTWNVTPETIEFIRQALYTTGNTLKARHVAKIGAPLIDYSLDGVEESSISPDRIEAYVDVDLPIALNTIGIHLVA